MLVAFTPKPQRERCHSERCGDVMYAPKLFQGRAGTRLERDQKRAGGRGRRRGPDPLHFTPQAGYR